MATPLGGAGPWYLRRQLARGIDVMWDVQVNIISGFRLIRC